MKWIKSSDPWSFVLVGSGVKLSAAEVLLVVNVIAFEAQDFVNNPVFHYLKPCFVYFLL